MEKIFRYTDGPQYIGDPRMDISWSVLAGVLRSFEPSYLSHIKLEVVKCWFVFLIS